MERTEPLSHEAGLAHGARCCPRRRAARRRLGLGSSLRSKGGRIDIVELAGNGNDKLIFKDLKRSDVDVSL
ncbi:MAG: hypothetical protein RLN74_10950, partial [Ilumatobacter fluminis]